jgi:hypothetical protein
MGPLEQCLPTHWPPRSVSAVICRATVLDVAQAQVPGSGPAANAALTDPGQPRAGVSWMRTS